MQKIFQLLMQPISYGIMLISFFVLILPVSILALPFKQAKRLRITQKFWALFGMIILRAGCLCKIYKEDNRDAASQAQDIPTGLYIANHSSFMDIPLILTCFRIPPMMKKEVLYIPIFGLCGYSAGAIIVDRRSSSSRKQAFDLAAGRLLEGNKCLQVYPEGTRQRHSDWPKEYKEIKKPLLKFAYENKVPVYALSIYGTRKILSSRGLINYGKKIGIILHPKTSPEDFTDMDSFMQACWQKVTSGHQRLTEKLS